MPDAPATAGQIRQFSCAQCGAPVEWDPAAGVQRCAKCGTAIQPPAPTTAVAELDFLTWARTSVGDEHLEERLIVHCAGCGGETTFGTNVTAGHCAFCGAAITAQGISRKLIKPTAVLPFHVTRDASLDQFKHWIGTLWFAPSALKQMAAAESNRLRGVYIPYWTYDADTTTNYAGMRGDDYLETETYTEEENGQTVTRTRTVTRTNWFPVSGIVQNTFDDVLVPAGGSIPRPIIDKLEPWDLGALRPFADEYLAGFESESYRVDLATGFTNAQTLMKPVIEQAICADIGGNHQTVQNTDTSYRDVTFKHVLLPMWICSYRFRDKIFRFVVNARTGEVQGERPWSAVKIAAAAIAALAVVAGLVYLYTQRR